MEFRHHMHIPSTTKSWRNYVLRTHRSRTCRGRIRRCRTNASTSRTCTRQFDRIATCILRTSSGRRRRSVTSRRSTNGWLSRCNNSGTRSKPRTKSWCSWTRSTRKSRVRTWRSRQTGIEPWRRSSRPRRWSRTSKTTSVI